MKNLKRIVAVILATALLVCSFTFMTAFADDSTTDTTTTTTTISDDTPVARMTLGYRDGAKAFEGHAFLYFENLTDQKIKVGVYNVYPNGGVSVGTFGTMDEGPGLYYNVEAYRYNFLKLTDYISLTKTITAAELEQVSEKITNSGFWNKFFNCTYFALTTWNIVPGQSMPWLIFPEICNIEIKSYSNHGGYFKMKTPKETSVYKQEGEGAAATKHQTSWHMEADTIR